MKACLKMNPAERMTVEQALKHPYLINFSLQDNSRLQTNFRLQYTRVLAFLKWRRRVN